MTIKIKSMMLPTPDKVNGKYVWRNKYKNGTQVYDKEDLSTNVVKGFLYKYKKFYTVIDDLEPVIPDTEIPAPASVTEDDVSPESEVIVTSDDPVYNVNDDEGYTEENNEVTDNVDEAADIEE